MKKTFLLCLLLAATSLQAKPKHVLIIGLDGLCTEGVHTASTPHIDQLLSESQYTFTARNVIPSITLPNWTSHLTGSGPERHGVLTNKWTRETAELDAIAKDQDGYYPSIFKVLKENVRGMKTAYYWNWKELINSMNPRYMDEKNFEPADGYEDNYRRALAFMTAHRQEPTFVFLYSVHTDHAGHRHGWMTPPYIQAIEEADTAIGQLLQQMKDAGLYDDTFIILMTDHGGVERGHGGYSDAEMRIPWAIRGPGIKPGEMKEQFFTVNTAAIIAHIFGASTPAEWAGRCNIRIR